MTAGRRGGGPELGPKKLRALLTRLLNRTPDPDADEELRFHFEMRVRDYVHRGFSEEEARSAARSRIGDEQAIAEACKRIDRQAHRRENRRAWLGEIAQDLQYGVRALRRSPVFALVAVGTLTAGVGATTAIFSMVDAVLLTPLPYAQPDHLVRLWETSPQGATRNVVSSGNVVDWQEGARSFDIIAAHRAPYGVAMTGQGDATRVQVVDLQPEVLAALGTPPALGRPLLAGDADTGDAVLLSHAFWTTRFGADPSVLGQRVTLNDVPHTVVGVMPQSFAFPANTPDLWRPVETEFFDPNERTSHNYEVVALLRPGVSVGEAQSEMTALASAIAQRHPAEMMGWGVRVVPFHADLTRDARTLLWVLLGGVSVVLLIGCGNLANLLMARAAAREREMAVRGAMGAGRGRIVRQLLTESGLLAFLGGLGALLLAPALLGVLVAGAPPDLPLIDRARIDVRMFTFAAAVSFACAATFGLVPALRLSRTDLNRALRGTRTTAGTPQARLGEGLLVSQVAFSVVLLVGAGLLVQSFRALNATDPGFDPDGMTVMEMDLPFARYGDNAQQAGLYDAVIERARAVPGVEAAAAASMTPASGQSMTFSFSIEGREASNPSGREDDELLVAVTPGYFDVMRQAVLDGRAFDDGDGPEGVPVVIISQSLADKHWPTGGAVGSRISFRAGETPWREVVGVVQDARLESPDLDPGPVVYVPHAQKQWSWLTWMGVLARRADGVGPGPVAEGLRAAVVEVDPLLPPHGITTIDERFRATTAKRTFAMRLVSGFGGLALLLSLVGLYGILGYMLARQRREIGLRLAMGADRTDIVSRVLGRSLALTLLGAALGVGASVGLVRLVDSLLYGVSPTSPGVYTTIVLGVTLVAGLTAMGPARRAAGTDPLEALAAE